ncbi:MAG: HAD-IIIA family hydrolase [Verrucomicrobia bacterium]|nr:HAD-IIIA family hydrolase [Verrucomicrobiota bacterium]
MIFEHLPPPAPSATRGGALFLDRDGTLIYDRHYLADPAGVELLPGVAGALREALAKGYRLFLHTNQSGIARGLFQLDDVLRCNVRMDELLALPRPIFAAICIAPEGPGDPAIYRKPTPRFPLEMMTRYRLDPAHCWMVGDRESDVETGLAAGIGAIAVCTGKHDAAGWAKVAPAGVRIFPGLADFVATLEPLPPAASHA